MRPGGWLVAAALLLALFVLVEARDGDGGGSRRVVLWGDSLAWEAREPFRRAAAAAGDTAVMLRTYGGTAPCDWLDDIRRQSRRFRPEVAVLAFSGNAGSDCMRGRDLSTAYREDVTAAVRQLARQGTRVLLVEAPARRDQAVDAAGQTELGRLWRQIAAARSAEADTTVVPAGQAVTDHGRFAERLPCAPGEQCEPDGTVIVRSPDGVHFCPQQLPPIARCPVPSPGAERYGRAMGDAAAQLLGPAPGRGAGPFA
ncbi:MAG: hypothetical protein IRZ08_14465 [Frankia sp.]|nr:hypothetical protein [Frankia sp.]